MIHKLLPLFKPESTSALEGEELVTAEIGNADKMRALKSLIEMLRAVDEMNEVSHAHKHFPKIIASYDDGKDEAELKELKDSLELHEDDLKEKEKKISAELRLKGERQKDCPSKTRKQCRNGKAPYKKKA